MKSRGAPTPRLTLNIDAVHMGFISERLMWLTDERGIWLDALNGERPVPIPDSSGDGGSGPTFPMSAAFWGKPGDGWLISRRRAWRHVGHTVVSRAAELEQATLPAGDCGGPPYGLVTAAANWIAVVEDCAVRVLRQRPPSAAADLARLLGRRTAAPWKVVLAREGMTASRLVATVDGRSFGVITPVMCHYLSSAEDRAGTGVEVQPEGHPESGALHPDGDILAVCSPSLDLVGRSGAVARIAPPLHRAAAFSADGRFLVFVAGHEFEDGDLTAWDLVGDDVRVIGRVQQGAHQTRIEFSPSGHQLAVAGRAVDIYDWVDVSDRWSSLAISTVTTSRRHSTRSAGR